jgi:predicted AlkP superfamily phosphohydrolase/phosphomutase
LKDSVIIAEGFGPDSSKGMVNPPSWKEKALSVPVPRFLPYEQLLSETGDKRIINAYESDRKVFAMAFEIMEEKKPDLMMVRFHNLEMVSQMFYKYARPYSLDHYEPVSKEKRDKYADVMAMHYEFVDRLIGGLLGLSQGYTVVVVSEHGLGPAYPPHNIFADLNSLMERMGHLDYYGSSCEDILTRIMERGELKVPSPPSANIFAMCQKLENETRKWVADGKPKMDPPAVEAYIAVHFELADPRSEKERERRKKEMVMLSNKLIPGKKRKDIMWKRTRVWNVEDTEKDVRGLYINLAGREPEGVVDRDNFHSFRKKVIKDLKRLRTENGDRLFKSVRANPRKDVNPMTLADSPDILVKVDREPLLHNYGMQSPNDPDPLPIAAIRTVYSDVSALPTNDGLIAISGKNASTFQHVDMKALDFAPTVLWLLGLPASADMPGEAKKQAFDKKIHNRSMLYIESWEEALKMRK